MGRGVRRRVAACSSVRRGLRRGVQCGGAVSGAASFIEAVASPIEAVASPLYILPTGLILRLFESISSYLKEHQTTLLSTPFKVRNFCIHIGA